MNHDQVEYRDVPGFPFYRAGSDGSVHSCRGRAGKIGAWKRMSGSPVGRQRRLMVKLYRADGVHRLFIHTIVLLTFKGPQPQGMEACHGDGNQHNNRSDNLRWDTHLANMQDRRDHGRQLDGEKSPRAKLTAEQVSEIRARCSAGQRQRDVATEYGVSKSTVGAIMTGDRWKLMWAKDKETVG